LVQRPRGQHLRRSDITERRQFILGAGAALVALGGAWPALAATTPYTPAGLVAAKAAGKPFLLDFFADWCVTCAAQHRVLDKLRAAHPAYVAIPFIQVDWDAEEHGPLVRAMKIPRRSTLVVLKGERELGRLVAETDPGKIEALLKLAL
jgi:thiol-disulfide isomerase/thioredoxin